VVHHDAHCANVLFRDGRLVALIDFDDACPGPLVGDVGVLLGAWAIDRATDALVPERAVRLLRAYEAERPLRDAERDLLPDVLALYLLGDAAAGVQDVLADAAPGAAVEAAVREEAQYRRFRRCTAGGDWREGLRRAMRGEPGEPGEPPAPPPPGGPRR
jgi:Ser/Thr protein kinase RdoA (MazF antagonist)